MKELFKEIKFPMDIKYEGWIRFEIGMEDISYEKRYVESAYARSIMLFEEVFKPNDDLLLVIDAPFVIEYLKEHGLFDDKIKTNLVSDLAPFILNKDLINSVDFIKGKDCCYNDDEDMVMFRSIIECKVKDINYNKLLKSICNKDMGLEPYYLEYVYFIHKEKKIEYYLYDDRGMDLSSMKKESLVEIYHKYNSWILDYDRNRIDRIFK